MKNLILLAALFIYSHSFAQTSNASVISDDSLAKLDIFQVCKALGIPSEYNKRYEAIILPLCDVGVHLFDAKTNPNCEGSESLDMYGRLGICYCYVGNSFQNKILIRNLIANRDLLTDGKLTIQNAKHWKVVK